MLSTTPVKGSGSTLAYQLASTFTPVGELKNFDGPEADVAKIDTTILASAAKTSIPSIPDNGEVTFSVYLVAADPTVVQLQAWSQAPLTVPWRVQVPDGSSPTTGTTLTFSAYLSKFAPKGFEVDATPMAEITLTVTGLVVMTPGS